MATNDSDDERMSKRVSVEDLEEHVDDPEERIEYVDTGEVLQQGGDELTVNQEAPGEDISEEMLMEDEQRADSWLHFNKGVQQTGFSPSEALTPDNIDQLEEEYVYETDTGGMQTTTTIAPGDEDTPPVMYFLGQNTKVYAINARTGEEYWSYQWSYGRTDLPTKERFRGLSVVGDKVIFGTGDLHMVALNRYTGEHQWETNTRAAIDTVQDLPFPYVGYSHSPAPVIYDGMIYCGQVGGDASLMGHAHMVGYDLETGEVEWTTKMAPRDEWLGDLWKHANASPWMSPAIDPESDTLFVNSGNPRPMMNPLVRPGPNAMSGGVVALDAKTGEVKWHHQGSPQDHWDYDGQFTPSVFTAEIDGKERTAVTYDHKNGWNYVHDAETGRILSRTPYAKQKNVHSFTGHGKENGTECWPGRAGGTNYPADGMSPNTGYRYTGSQDTGELMWMWDFQYPEEGVGTPGRGTGPDGEDDISGGGAEQADAQFDAFVTATDLHTGERAWRTRLPDTEDVTNHTFLMYPGGTTATGGGVVFSGSSGGHLYALDEESGEMLWEADTGERITASPVVFEDPGDGSVFVTVAASDRIMAYKADVDLDSDDGSSDDGSSDDGSSDDGSSDDGSSDDGSSDDAGDDAGDDSSDGDGAGFGFITALAGAGAGTAAAAKRLMGDDNEEEE